MRQITVPRVMDCLHIYPDGRIEKVRYGQYEAFTIKSENGWDVNRCRTLAVPYYLVSEVVKSDGTIVVFDEPWYCIEQQRFGDKSGRLAEMRQ